MNKQTLQQKLQEWVQTDLQLTIDCLLDISKIEKFDADYINQITMQSCALHDYTKSLSEGLAVPRDLEPQKNRIRRSVIEIINELPDFETYDIPTELRKQKTLVSEKILKEAQRKLGKSIYDSLKLSDREKVKKEFYMKLDREHQEREFKKFVKMRKDFTRPIIFFVHGFSDDQTSYLVDRLTYIAQTEYEKNVINLKPDQFESGNEEDLKFDIVNNIEEVVKTEIAKRRKSLDKKTNTANGEYIIKMEEIDKQIIAVEQIVNSSVWNKALCNVIENWYIADYWNFKLAETDTPFLIFLNINYNKQKKSFFKSIFGKTDKNIEKEIEAIHNKYKDSTIYIPRLEEIEIHHIKSFLEEYDLDYIDFIKEGEKLSFHEFFRRCKDHIAYWLASKDKEVYEK